MGSYRNDDEALIGLARQLTDAYGEARSREDQDYACDSIAEYLSEFRETAPGEALLAIFDLPLTAETYPLVDEAQTSLAGRGSAVVGLLVAAALGNVYDPDGPAAERAAETLDSMDPREASLGLAAVLCGRGDDGLKGAALDALVALGGVAEPDLVVTLDDPVGGDWARAALEQIRFAREHPGDARWEAPDDVDERGLEDAIGDRLDATAVDETDAPPVDVTDAATGMAGPQGRAASGEPTAPDKGLVDDAYEDFLRRYEQESGGEAGGRGGSPGDLPGESTAP
jgi:hypothetical protein